MLRRISLLGLCAFACLTLSACLVRTTVESSNLNGASSQSYKFANVNLASSAKEDVKPKTAEKIDKNFDKWSAKMGAAFDKQAGKKGIDGDGVAVSATVTKFNPGNRWLRWVWGYSRKSWATATVQFDCGAAGSFTMEGEMRAGWWMGGTPTTLFNSMGRAAAKHLAKSE